MSIYERFLAQVDQSPEAIALTEDDRSWSYWELAQAARRLTTQLAEAGVRSGGLVGLQLPRSAQVVIAILGILGHGCGYVPIDPAYPRERQSLIEKEARLKMVVKSQSGQLILQPAASDPDQPPWEVPAGTAYVIFTSGTTGAPKGVVIGNEHVLALLDACREVYDFSPADAWSWFHSHSFDFSVWELWGALLSGGRAVVVPAATAADPGRLADLLAAERVTVLNQVPSAFVHLAAALEERPYSLHSLPALRYVIFGGEPVRLSAVRRWIEQERAPGARVVNMYGLTETTVHVTYCLLTEKELAAAPGATPIGVPLPHLQVRLVDGGRPAPPGTPGEMVVSGRSVSHGYLGRPDLTAERFVNLPDGTGTAYLTGDWAVADPQGKLFYLGRRDRQVKVRGFRIELGEIEAVVSSYPGIAHCAVTTSERLGEPVLAAHYACWPDTPVAPGSLRSYLAQRLPAYMVPARLRPHSSLPLTAQGKVDPAALA